jgi:anaerobic selenocysteine-containing dehydrogenase
MEETGIGSLPVGWTHGGINMCSYRHQIVEPIGEAWPNWKIWSELGRRLGHGEHFPWNSNEEVTAMMLSETGIPLEDLKNTPGQIRLEVEYGHHRYEGFPSQSGKVEFFSHAFEAAGQSPLPVHREPTQSPVSSPELAEKYPMILVSGIRVREYIHSALRHMDKLKAMRPEPEAEIHPDAAKKYGIENGKNVEVATKSGAVIMKARVTEDIHPDVVAIPHGWAKANANALIDDEDREPTAGYPQDKGLLCSIKSVN